MAGPASRGARLMYVLLLQRDVPAATRFYKDGLGLAVTAASPTWAQVRRRSGSGRRGRAEEPAGGTDRAAAGRTPTQLEDGGGGGVGLALKAAAGEAQSTAGYSPFLAFQVPDLQAAVERLLGLGARLDGAIKYGPHGKTAALRAPDDHMLSLFESADPPGGTGERGREADGPA